MIMIYLGETQKQHIFNMICAFLKSQNGGEKSEA